MEKISVLLLEDDRDIRDLIKYNLEEEEFHVFPAGDGLEALSILNDEVIDLAVLDVMVPEISGTEIGRKMRRDNRLKDIPILFLSAKSEEADKLVGFMVGGDDYVTKPFSPKELVARVKAILRRSKNTNGYHNIQELEIYFDRHIVKVKDRRVKLTLKEFNVLKALVTGNQKTLSREQLLEKVWGMESNSSGRSVDIVIARLREKLGDYGKCICTITGFGYQWDEEVMTEA